MRPARSVLLVLLTVAMTATLLSGILLIRIGTNATGQDPGAAPQTADQTPLGTFIPASAPRPAPQISFTDASGKSVSLSAFDGKVVLLNLWATWCAPCRREMPSLERLQARSGDRMAVLAISEDFGGSKVVAPFVAKLGLTTIKTYLDPKGAVGQAFKVTGLPTSIVLDRHGRVRGRVEGEANWDGPKMLAVIEPLLRPGDIVKSSLPRVHP
jgi:thiol-disulfide isomerase/thioredoxin